jgi:hypothetical protein
MDTGKINGDLNIIEAASGPGENVEWLQKYAKNLMLQDLNKGYLSLAFITHAGLYRSQQLIKELQCSHLTQMKLQPNMWNLMIGFGLLGYIKEQEINSFFTLLHKAKCNRLAVRESIVKDGEQEVWDKEQQYMSRSRAHYFRIFQGCTSVAVEVEEEHACPHHTDPAYGDLLYLHLTFRKIEEEKPKIKKNKSMPKSKSKPKTISKNPEEV